MGPFLQAAPLGDTFSARQFRKTKVELGSADVDGHATSRVKRTEPFKGSRFAKPRIEPPAGRNDERTNLMICRVFVDDSQMISKPKVEVCWNNVDVVPQAYAHGGP